MPPFPARAGAGPVERPKQMKKPGMRMPAAPEIALHSQAPSLAAETLEMRAATGIPRKMGRALMLCRWLARVNAG